MSKKKKPHGAALDAADGQAAVSGQHTEERGVNTARDGARPLAEHQQLGHQKAGGTSAFRKRMTGR